MFSSKALPPTFASALGIMTHPVLLVTWMSLALISYWYFDEAIAFYIRENLPKPTAGTLKQISKLGIAGYYIAGFLIVYLISRFALVNAKLTKIFVYLSSALIIPGILCDIIKMCFGRYRPRMLFNADLYGFHFFTLQSKMWSFPSGHSVTFMGLMVALSFLYPKRWYWFWLCGITVSFTRVLVTAHFLSDVMVGIYLGAIGAYFCYAWVQYSEFVQRWLLLDEAKQAFPKKKAYQE